MSSDQKNERMLKQAQDHLKQRIGSYQEKWSDLAKDGPNILLGYDGLVFDFDDKS